MDILSLTAQLLLLCCCCRGLNAVFAKSAYYMDSISDCYLSGFLLVRTDEIVNINSRKASSGSSDVLLCRMSFRPNDKRDIMDVSFTHLTMSDKDVTLDIALSGAGSHALIAGSNKPDKMTSKGGEVIIVLTRNNRNDDQYSFGITLRVYKEDDSLLGDDEKPIATGLIVGIVAGVIVFIIFIAIIAICCCRRMSSKNPREADDHKVDLTTTTKPAPNRFGLDNVARNGNYGPREEESPPLQKKRLETQNKRDNREQSDSESDSDSGESPMVRKYDRSPTKSTAVRYEDERDRFSGGPQQSGRRGVGGSSYRDDDEPFRRRDVNDQADRDDRGQREEWKPRERNAREDRMPERNQREEWKPRDDRNQTEDRTPERNLREEIKFREENNLKEEWKPRGGRNTAPPGRRREADVQNYRQDNDVPPRRRNTVDQNVDRRDNNAPLRRDDTTEDEARETGSESQKKTLPPKSPILTALRNHPRFRASMQRAQRETEERTETVEGEVEEDPGHESDYSMTETWNTTFDTNFDDDPRPPQGTFIKPPSLPPIPMSPITPTKGENTATIHSAPRPSSSSSEIEHLQNGGVVAAEVSMNPAGQPPAPLPSEIVAIRVQDPHSPTNKRKADTQHTLRPDRSKGLAIKQSVKNSSHSPKPDSIEASPKPEKSTKHKTKTKRDTAKTIEKRTEHEDDAPEDRSRPREPKRKGTEGKAKTTEGKSKTSEGRSKAREGSEYEGRFKKSDSARRSKSKSPRIGRSRSTGTALEDTDSIGQPSTPRGYRAVPQVTADDYEDSDMESNYNPLRRTGSKNSLYASRSSLYARRRRKNSLGESVYSLAQDDLDYSQADRDSFKQRSLSRRDRGFRSLGDLEFEIQEQETRSTQTLRECATQTGAGFANVSPGKKTVVKKGKPKRMNSSQTQTAKSKSQHLDTSSSSSGVTRPRQRKNSGSSASGRSKSREGKTSSSSVSGRPKRSKSESELKTRQDEDERRSETGKPKLKPKPKSKRGVGHVSEDDLESVRTGMTGPLDQSSLLGAQPYGAQPYGAQPYGAQPYGAQPFGAAQPYGAVVPGQQAMYPPQGYPGYPGQMAYTQATGQPPVMPFAQPSGLPHHTGSAVANPTLPAPTPNIPAPGSSPRPSLSKWDMLCRMTDADSGKGGDSYETGSVAGSVFSNAYAGQQFPPAFSVASSDYAGSERSGLSRSRPAGKQGSYRGHKSAWDALTEITDQEYAESQYAPSVSNV